MGISARTTRKKHGNKMKLRERIRQMIREELGKQSSLTFGQWNEIAKLGTPLESGVYIALTEFGTFLFLNFSSKHQAFNCFDYFENSHSSIEVTHWMFPPQRPIKRERGVQI